MERKHPIAEWMAAEKIADQGEAAKRLGISQQEVSDYVNWRHIPRIEKLTRLAERIGVPRDRFLPDVSRRRRKAVA